MAVAVIRNGKVIFRKTYGVKSEENKGDINENTVFSVGSVSKAFTGIGVMLLVQKGKIALDQPVKKYMKNLLPEKWGDITIRQFLTHTSGIPDLKGEKNTESFEQTIAGARNSPMAFSPGKKQQYNNFNFAVLGKLIETVSEMSYLDYMNRNIFQPLQMNRTNVNTADKNIAMGHLSKNGKMKEMETHFNPGDYGVPSGGLQTTLSDFIKLSQGLNENKILDKKTTALMWTPYSDKLSNTPGWHSRMIKKEIIIHKAGGGTGIGSTCDLKIVPSRKIYIIVMTNKANNAISPSDISDDILLKCFDIPKGGKGDEGEGE
jgi:CubicO group peptidase (beta-lactamase class C family)